MHVEGTQSTRMIGLGEWILKVTWIATEQEEGGCFSFLFFFFFPQIVGDTVIQASP